MSNQPLTPDQIAALWQDMTDAMALCHPGEWRNACCARDALQSEMSRQAARVAALEAELAALRDGLTGTPKKAGRYWCEWIGRRAAARHEAWWEHDHGWIDSDGNKIGTPTRYWPLPGESYQ
jgi:predicted transcriptional regulator